MEGAHYHYSQSTQVGSCIASTLMTKTGGREDPEGDTKQLSRK